MSGAALARAEAAGIHALTLPTPFAVGPVNCYLIDGEPLTLVDTGPNSGTALDVLARSLRDHGRRIEDLELIVITHQHADHLGLLEVLAGRSGADVAALAPLGRWLAEFPASQEADDAFAQALMRRHGVPDDVVTALGQVSAAFRPYGSHAEVSVTLHDGEVLPAGDLALQVQHRPGHSPTDTLFWEPERRLLLGGDHLLAHISSNATVTRPPEGGPIRGGRPRSLVAYLESLRRTRELGAEVVLGGHGPPVTDPATLIDSRIALHRRRAERILALLGEGPLSAHEIATTMWANVAVTQAYLTLSEVLGHLDLLIEEGAVDELEDAGLSRFAATP